MNTELFNAAAAECSAKSQEAVLDVVNTKLQTVGLPVTGATFKGWLHYEHPSDFSADGKFHTWSAPESDTSVSLSDEMAKSISSPAELGEQKAWAIVTIAPAKKAGARFDYYVNLKLRWAEPRKVAHSIAEAMKMAEGVKGIDRRLSEGIAAAAAAAQAAIGQ